MRFGVILALHVVITLAVPHVVHSQDFSSLEDTRHDLAVYPPIAGASQEEQAHCVVCHAPRGQSLAVGAWNEDEAESLLVYPYDRAAAAAPAGKPDGASLACLGCHDGIIALGDIASGGGAADPGENHARTSLSDGHPVSVAHTPTSGNRGMVLLDPAGLPEHVAVDANGKVQCTTCHDPHDDTRGSFLVAEDSYKGLCLACHDDPGWYASAHNNSAATWNGEGPDPWPFAGSRGTVGEHGCANCHTPHSAGDGRNLLNYSREEDNCLSCHNGNVASTNIEAEFNKVSHHPVQLTAGVHSADEQVLIAPADRHVECVDCHSAHAARTVEAGRGFVLPVDIPGIDINGAPTPNAVTEYEMCFRCHGDGAGRRAMPTPRVHDQSNVRLQFDAGNPSFHPVVGPGTNTDVPSLIAPLAENSLIECGDCHASDADSRLGGMGPDGPHGSIYPSLLIRNYQTRDRTPESPNAYGLCYSCHDRNSILADESFPEHRSHVSSNSVPCSACHDPHGISVTQGTPEANSHLINFDTSIVFPNANNELRFEDRGSVSGACYLACHNSDHDGRAYE